MAITWADFHNYIRVGILNDEGAQPRWSPAQLLLFTGWAMDSFCAHTAMVKEYTESGFSGNAITLPTDVYDNFGLTAHVKIGNEVYRSAYHTPGVGPSSQGYFYVEVQEDDQRILNLNSAVNNKDVLIRYFAHYPHPTEDSDLILIPQWSYSAVGHLVGSYAQSNYAMRRAQLSQWAETPEKGGPEDNPFRIMERWFTSIYNREIGQVQPQNRANYFGDRD